MPIKVLVVDDSVFVRQMLTKILANDHRFNLVGTANNGKQALDKVRELSPDVITLDVEMPVMSGIEALVAISKEFPTPVVMLSSLTKKGARTTIKALEIGAVDFITKPDGVLAQNLGLIESELKDKLIVAASARPQKLRKKKLLEVKIPVIQNLENLKAKILVIGASTGGPSALSEVVNSLPENIGIPVLVLQHMPVGFTALLAERLNNSSKIPVVEAQKGEYLASNKVYIMPAGTQPVLTEKAGKIQLDLTEKSAMPTSFKPSFDILLYEAIKVFGKHVLGVVLTGMGNDGLRGVKALKTLGGRVLAQSPETCVVYGMPKAVVEAGLADEVVPIFEMTQTIIKNLR